MSKTKIRRVWILRALLDCKEWSQKDIRNLFHLMALANYFRLIRFAKAGLYFTENSKSKGYERAIEKYKDYLKGHKDDIPPKMKSQIKETITENIIKETVFELNKNKPEKSYKTGVSEALEYKDNSGLVDRKIVKKDYGVKTVTSKHSSKIGPKYSLVEDYRTLYYILKEFNDQDLPSSLQKDMLDQLMQSEYSNRLINRKLIDKIKLELKLELNDEEENLLFFLLKNSPTILYNILKKIYDDPLWKEIKETNLWVVEDANQRKNSFFMDIKFWLYEDLQRDLKISQYEVDFTISISIDTGKDILSHNNSYKIINPEDEMLKQEIHKAQLEGVMKAISGEKISFNSNKSEKIKNNDILEVPDYLKDPEAMQELKDTWKKRGYISIQIRNALLKDIKNAAGKKNIFIKNSGDKIDEKLWLNPPNGEKAPY